MSDIVRDTIAALTAQLIKLSSTTVAPFGYGVDLLCVSDIDLNMAETDSTTTQSLGQDCYHRITTARGSLPGDSDYGIDIRSMLSAGLTQATVRSITTQVHNELIKDDRIADAQCDLAQSGVLLRPTFTLSITITPNDPALTAFNLIISVTDGVSLLAAINK